MRILIGILYCIENELSACIQSIKNQTHQDFDYFIIENLPKKAAHDQLYTKFSASRQAYDIFIKIDADMVLCRSTYFEEVIDAFSKDHELVLLQVAVYDFFSDQLIFGLHNYRNTMRWALRDEVLFTDRQNTSEKSINDSTQLAPAALHCPDPSPFQAFHFGVHKAVKVMQIGRASKNVKARNIHWDNIQRTKEHFRSNKNKQLGYAILGSEIAFKHQFTHQQVDYNDTLLQQHFNSVKDKSLNEIEQAIYKNAIFRRFPSTVRLALISIVSECDSIFHISWLTYYQILKNSFKRLLKSKRHVVR